MKIQKLASSAALVTALLVPAAVSAIGTYSRGQILVQKLTKFESRGLIWESFEGEAEVALFDSGEKCNTKESQCYTPTKGLIKFSIRPENAEVINYLRKQIGQGGFLLQYRIHKFEALALEQDMEILSYSERTAAKPAGMSDQLALKEKPGSRSFSVQGRILDLGYRGTLINTHEGLYENTKTGKVHPFSINDDALAKFAMQAMSTTTPYYLGVSQAKVSIFYSSDHFLFEINFKEEAGSVMKDPPKAEAKAAPKAAPKAEPKAEPKTESKKEAPTP